MSAGEKLSHDSLRTESNPFASKVSGLRINRPLQTALDQVIRHIVLQTAAIVVAGSAGTGKSLLAEMTARACSDAGLSVRRVDRGDLVHLALSQRSDLLLIDEADVIDDTTLGWLLAADSKRPAKTMLFLCLSSGAGRFAISGVRPVMIEVTPLSQHYVRNHLLGWADSAGFPNLFAPEALDLVAYGSRGSPRLLRSIASLAFFSAASNGASQIRVEHVEYALASHIIDGDIRSASCGEGSNQARQQRAAAFERATSQ